MIKIIPAILTKDPAELVEKLERAGGIVERVQIDVIDGVFADNQTADLAVFNDIESPLKLDFHLMVKEPVNWIEKAFRAGADRIIGQIEMMSDQKEFTEKVQELGALVGLALDLNTPASKLDPMILTNLDVVLVMSVPAGFGEQKFDKRALDKISKLDEIRSRNIPFSICDDGGVSLRYIDDVRRAGVDEVAVGSRIFKGDLKKNIERYIKAAYGK